MQNSNEMTNAVTEQTVKITQEQALEKFTNLFREVNTLNEDIKSVAEQAKESDLDVSTIKATAKLLATEGYQAYREKSEAILDLLEQQGK